MTTRVLASFTDDFARPDVTGIANVGNGWFGSNADANISGGDLVRTDPGHYGQLLNDGGGIMPADYTVSTVIPHTAQGPYTFLTGRWDGTNGVRAGFENGITEGDIAIGQASDFGAGNVTLTMDAGLPASWQNVQDHTLELRMVGSTVTFVVDGQDVCHGTVAVNPTLTGSAFGVGGGSPTVYHSISAQGGTDEPIPVPPVSTRPFTTTRPPPVESLGKAYFTPLLAIPVVTRLPQPAPNRDTVDEFLRVQSGGGAQRADQYLWDVSLILHSYSPNENEALAEDNLGIALGWGANAQGTTITLKSGAQWYVTYSRATGLGSRSGDPYVDLTRYRGMVTWRVMGKAL